MCVACGDISSTTATSASLLTTVATVSPLLAVWLYPLYRSFSLQKLLERRVSQWRLAAHISLYSFSMYMCIALLGYIAGRHGSYWNEFAIIAVLSTVAVTIYSTRIVVKHSTSTSVSQATVLAVVHAVPFVVMNGLANFTLHTEYMIGYRWHLVFGSQTSIITGLFSAALLFLGIYWSTLNSK